MRSAPALLLILFACESDTVATEAAGGCPGAELLVAASDFESSVACHAPGCVEDERTTGVDLGNDPMLVGDRGRVFWLSRDRDLVFELDPSCGAPRAKTNLVEFRTPTARANPHDVASVDDATLLVALYNTPKLVFVKNGEVDGDLDLSSFDEDGNPQAESVRVVPVGGVPKAFVALERLDDRSTPPLQSTRPSQMLRIDVATRTVEATIDLAGRNPFNPMVELGGALFLAEPGRFDADDDEHAGIERFDTATSTTKLLAAERALGGSVSEIAVRPGCGVAIAAGPQPGVNPTAIVTFDPDTGAVLRSYASPVLGPTPGYDLQGLTWHGSTLWVGDRRAVQNQFLVHELALTGACELTETGRSLSLPRAPVAFLPAKP
ncbi:MAG: hypothetical protein KIT84_32985 [Labilithrix sp.]|nr:hypothetical protein [Labilithrix sp.]MCW5815891.1 hypothetical protein [Labilithrix sp.]